MRQITSSLPAAPRCALWQHAWEVGRDSGAGTPRVGQSEKPRGLLFTTAAVLSLYSRFLGLPQLISIRLDCEVHPPVDSCATSQIQPYLSADDSPSTVCLGKANYVSFSKLWYFPPCKSQCFLMKPFLASLLVFPWPPSVLPMVI